MKFDWSSRYFGNSRRQKAILFCRLSFKNNCKDQNSQMVEMKNMVYAFTTGCGIQRPTSDDNFWSKCVRPVALKESQKRFNLILTIIDNVGDRGDDNCVPLILRKPTNPFINFCSHRKLFGAHIPFSLYVGTVPAFIIWKDISPSST